ncbi:methyltransferase domain-containing protein [Candidatus Saganbacteria bacterium]|nr:methyltransferase domain-containing protein [Candidatus Saganbacteria bacterium]
MKDFNKIDFLIQKRRIKLIENFVPPNSYILDIGCGYYPQNLINLRQKIKQAVGIDKDIPDTVLAPNIRFIKTEFKTIIPLPNNEFDCVLILAVLEHLDHPPEIIRECYRVLKPGGRIIITIPTNYSKAILLILAYLGLISKEEIFDHKHYFRKEEINKMLLQAKFKKIIGRSYNFGINALFVFEK